MLLVGHHLLFDSCNWQHWNAEYAICVVQQVTVWVSVALLDILAFKCNMHVHTYYVTVAFRVFL